MKYLVYSILYVMSLLPFPVLYLISDIMYLVAYKIISYRKHVVRVNLSHAFKEKTPEERKQLEKKFYKNLCDLVVESISLLSVSEKTFRKRCELPETSTLDFIRKANQPIMLYASHNVNWEWGGHILGLKCNKPVMVVFKPLKNLSFNFIMKKARTHFTNEAVPMNHILRRLIKEKKKNPVACFMADQTPTLGEAGYWGRFFFREAPFFTGPEKLGQKLKSPAVFANVVKLKRGKYRLDLSLLSENIAAEETGEVTSKYVNALEEAIREKPESWLWTHRRWKLKREGKDKSFYKK